VTSLKRWGKSWFYC